MNCWLDENKREKFKSQKSIVVEKGQRKKEIGRGWKAEGGGRE